MIPWAPSRPLVTSTTGNVNVNPDLAEGSATNVKPITGEIQEKNVSLAIATQKALRHLNVITSLAFVFA